VNGNLIGKLSIGQGERGKSIEYMWRGTELGIRQEGEEEYQFVDLAGSGAGSGREIELQVGNGFIQWRYKGEESWNNLIAITELQVPGPPGKDGKNGLDGTNGQDGADGITPVKGQDYYTEEEKEELITEVLNRIPNGNEVAY
ncbi:hypothetical protein ACQPUY_17760, partial [Clostridium nigeriense]|uniref:hypothetical protein n=1 Tax=Clostridium nigeriense TaxID=1805470 RepID=UPI003D340039